MKKKVTEVLTANNIVPIIVALSTAFGGYKTMENRVGDIETKLKSVPTIQVMELQFKNMEDKIKSYNDNQKVINDLILRMMHDSSIDETTRKQLNFQRYNNYKTYKK